MYRPFTVRVLYHDAVLNDRPGLFSRFCSDRHQGDNCIIGLTNPGAEKPFMALVSQHIIDYHLVGAGAGAMSFPFYTYNEDGTNRRENITDWALETFQSHYENKKITKWDIFYYVYGVLHQTEYRTTFADNLKRELPRIPFMDNFKAFATAGKKLAELHLEYESLKPWPLKCVETPGVPLSYEVIKMKLSKDKTSLKVNDYLTLEGIPPEVERYRLGNRSALEWVIDQYQVSEDARSGITSDPNRLDDPEYIVRLVGQVVRVSVETVKLVESLPKGLGVGLEKLDVEQT
jgi:predicted helicase